MDDQARVNLNARKYAELPESNVKKGQQRRDVIHEKSAVTWINAPVHLSANRAEKFLMLQIHQNESERCRRYAHFPATI
jgi:hypothetical protein